ncbi:carbon-nitrogen hydrolase family protein, partial [Candidatus Bathyarchaeota archaeon]|nr:carbon-nitrogen hydrolase family protein [Candidatus Bathyarchaeota archaeon]
MKERVNVALAQISCKRGNKAENIRKIENTVTKAKQQGSELVIFPELSLTGYTLRD